MSFEAPFDKRGNCALLGVVLRSSRVKEKGFITDFLDIP